MLTKCECLGSAKLLPLLLDTSKSTLAFIGMLLGFHFHVVLGRASEPVVDEERAVTSVQYVYLRIGEIWVLVLVAIAILTADMFRPVT